MKHLITLAALLISATSFGQTSLNYLDLRWAGQKPYVSFFNDSGSPYDAKFELENDNQVILYGADLHVPEGDVQIVGVNRGLHVQGSGLSYIKLADYAGNPMFQFVADYQLRSGTMLVNHWGASSNPGITVGTTRANDGVAFNVVRGVTLDGIGLPNSEGEVIVTVLGNGNMGVGTTNPDAKLAVNGQVHATEIRVTATVPGPDYVFEKDYALTPLGDLKKYLAVNKHLPEVPSAKEMEKEGIKLGEMNLLLLKKIEELTLYVLELKEESDQQKKVITEQQKAIERLEK